jgi:hypothetical protein
LDRSFDGIKVVLYGRLLSIYVVTIPATADFRLLETETLLLARIKPCPITPGPIPATTSYSQTDFNHHSRPVIVDLRMISAVVGRLEYGERFYIIDRAADGSLDVPFANA